MRSLLLSCYLVVLAGCVSGARREVERVSESSDPASLPLQRGFNDYVRRAILKDGTEVGMITCQDGSFSRYWFRSHHLTQDHGGTLFRCSDGTVLFMSGYFCCEVQLPEQQLGSLLELRAFIREHDGVGP